jgi:hypothetical protein
MKPNGRPGKHPVPSAKGAGAAALFEATPETAFRALSGAARHQRTAAAGGVRRRALPRMLALAVLRHLRLKEKACDPVGAGPPPQPSQHHAVPPASPPARRVRPATLNTAGQR